MFKIKRIWIPITIFLTGAIIFTISIASVSTSLFSMGDVDRNEEIIGTRVDKTFDVLPQKVKITGNRVQNVNIQFSDITDTSVSVYGQNEDLTVELIGSELLIQTDSKLCRTIAINFNGFCNDTKYKEITVNIPKSFVGKIDIQTLSSNLNVQSDEQITFQQLDVDTLNSKIYFKDIQTNVSIDGLNNEVVADGFGGKIDSNGLNSEISASNITRDLSITNNGLNATTTIEFNDMISLFVETDGLNNTIINNVDMSKHSKFGSKSYSYNPKGTINVKIDNSGLSNEVILNSKVPVHS